MNLDIIEDREYLKKQIPLFKTPAKVLLNNITGYYLLSEDRAKDYFENVISMILLQSPNSNVENICIDLINNYSRKLDIYKSKGEKKKDISVIMFLLLIVVVLLFLSLFIIATWYKSVTPTYILLLANVCVIYYFMSVYSFHNDKRVQVLENLLSSLKKIVESYSVVNIPSEKDRVKADILNILKFLSAKEYIKLNFDIDSYSFKVGSELGVIPLTNIVRILHILIKYKKIEFSEDIEVKEFANIFAYHFKLMVSRLMLIHSKRHLIL